MSENQRHTHLLLLLLLLLAVVCGASEPGWAQAIEPPSPLLATVPASAKGDGQSALPVIISGGTGRGQDEMESRPMLPAVECAEATVLAATVSSPPMIIAPAVRTPIVLTCVARHRDDQKSFTVQVALPGPGLYADVSPRQPDTSTPGISMRPFSITSSGKVASAGKLRASASSGTLAEQDGGLFLTLPDAKAPRALAVAMTDGLQGGAIFLPLSGKTSLPVKSTPRTNVRVRIAGRWFGPVLALKRNSSVDITVPPGTNEAIVQAIGRAGSSKETLTDLKTPSLPRMAAIAATETVSAGESVSIFVAVASPSGGPAAADTPLVAQASRGKLGQAVPQAPGLWKLRYKATGELGEVEIRLSVGEQIDAGEVTLTLTTIAAPVGTLSLVVSEGPFGPGSEVTGTLEGRDAFGNLTNNQDGLSLTFLGEQIALQQKPGESSFRFKLPKKFPAKREMVLVANRGEIREVLQLFAMAGPATDATLRLQSEGRHARLVASVRDQYGNLVPADAYNLLTEDATVTVPMEHDEGITATVTAISLARSATVTIEADGRQLVRHIVVFDPPPNAILLGSYANGSWTSNRGELSVPRVGAGVGLRRGLGAIETSLLVGLEAFSMQDEVIANVDGMDLSLSRSLRGLAVPVMLRGRLPLSHLFGVSLAIGAVPVATSASLSLGPPAEQHQSWTLGTRLKTSADARLGPGRVTAGFSYGRARLDEGPVVGDIDGYGFFAGFEWWPLDLNQ